MYNFKSLRKGWIVPRKPPSLMSAEEQMEWCNDLALDFDFATPAERDALARTMYKAVRFMMKQEH